MNALLGRTVFIALVMLAAQTFAQKEETKAVPEKGPMMQHQMMHKHAGNEEGGKENESCGMAGGCPMHGMMMKDWTTSTMIATSDGGVVVRQGVKIYKYDKELNLVKEVELKMDMDAMAKAMNEMKEKCPWCKSAMEEKEKGAAKEEKAPVKKEMPKQEKK